MKRPLSVILVVAIVVIASVIGAFVFLSNVSKPSETVEQFAMSSQGGNISAFDSQVDLFVPNGALDAQHIISVKRAMPSNSSFVPGTAFDLGPNGLSFLKAIQLKVSYDPSNVPVGHSESDLSLARLENGMWRTLGASGVNETNDVVCGLTTSFSTYAVVVNTTKVVVHGPNYAFPSGKTELTFSFPVPMPEGVFAYGATWMESSTDGMLWQTTDESGGLGYSRVDVQYINGVPVHDSRIYFLPYNDARLGVVATVTLDIAITFDFNVMSAAYYHYGHASTTVEIDYPTVAIYPEKSDCAAGDQVIMTPDVLRTPSGFVPSWYWETNGIAGMLWEAGKDPATTPGSSRIMRTDTLYAIFRANDDATEGSVEHVTLSVWVEDPVNPGNMTAGLGRSNLTIKERAVSIEFDYLPMIDLRKQNSASFQAVLHGAPAGNKVYVWNTAGNVGGFGQQWPSMQKTYQATGPFAYYSGNGNGSDGDNDLITVKVYLVQDSGWKLLGNASASVELYYPQTQYKVLDQDKSTGFMGGSWDMYVVGHGPVYWVTGFYARQGDTLRIVCHFKGAEPSEPKDLYLWRGETKLLLVSYAEVVDGMDRTFLISI